MEVLKKIKILFTRNIDGLSFAEELDYSLVKDNEALFYFANLKNPSDAYTNLLNCIDKSDLNNNQIEEYLLCKLNELNKIHGDLISKMIMMDTINEYLEKQEKFKSLDYVKSEIIKTLDTLMMMADTYAELAETVSERTTSLGGDHRFLYANALELVGGMGGKVTYGVYPCYINGVLSFCDVYRINSAKMCVLFDFITTAKENIVVKKCENCGKFFTPSTRSDEIYCNNKYLSSGKTCKQIGYEVKVNNNEFLKAYRTAYKTKNAFKNRNINNNPHAEEDFKKWVYSAKMKLDEAQNGSISLEEFKEWLKK